MSSANNGHKWAISILGSSIGRVMVSSHDKLTAVTLVGSSKIDLARAEFTHEPITITVVVVAGSTTIYIPKETDVEVTGIIVLGSRRIDDIKHSTQTTSGKLRVRCIGCFGSVRAEYV